VPRIGAVIVATLPGLVLKLHVGVGTPILHNGIKLGRNALGGDCYGEVAHLACAELNLFGGIEGNLLVVLGYKCQLGGYLLGGDNQRKGVRIVLRWGLQLACTNGTLVARGFQVGELERKVTLHAIQIGTHNLLRPLVLNINDNLREEVIEFELHALLSGGHVALGRIHQVGSGVACVGRLVGLDAEADTTGQHLHGVPLVIVGVEGKNLAHILALVPLILLVAHKATLALGKLAVVYPRREACKVLNRRTLGLNKATLVGKEAQRIAHLKGCVGCPCEITHARHLNLKERTVVVDWRIYPREHFTARSDSEGHCHVGKKSEHSFHSH
jgi:hypothetical protein